MALIRPQQPMPKFVKDALETANLVKTHFARPAYQRSDCLMWINAAKRMETK